MPRASTLPVEQLRRDYLLWHEAQVSSGDLDPMYSVLRRVADAWGLDDEGRAWLCVLHVVWYHPGATFAAFRRAPSLEALPRSPEALEEAGLLSLPTGTERRGHRAVPPLVSHLLSLPRVMPEGAYAFARRAIGPHSDPRHGWVALNERLASVPGNGRWAAYKTAELWQKVAGLPVAAADAGHAHSSGPRKGLALLERSVPAHGDNRPSSIARLDRMTEAWARRLGEDDIAQVETSLCDFHSLVKGRYYLGHDIDSMQGDLLSDRLPDPTPEEVWEARGDCFEPRFLGEVGGWIGVRKVLKSAYRDRGEMTWN